MIYTFLISIVFIAEIIIAVSLIKSLINIDKIIIEKNELIRELKPSIIDIVDLMTKVTAQCKILTKDYVEKIKKNGEDLAFKHLAKILLGILAIGLNIKIVNKIRKSKVTKLVMKGFSFLENMV